MADVPRRPTRGTAISQDPPLWMRAYRGIVEEHKAKRKPLTPEQAHELNSLLTRNVEKFSDTPLGRDVLKSKASAWERHWAKKITGKDAGNMDPMGLLVHDVIHNPVDTLEVRENRIFIQDNLGAFADRLSIELRKKQYKHRRKTPNDYWVRKDQISSSKRGDGIEFSGAEISARRAYEKGFFVDDVFLSCWLEFLPDPVVPPLCLCSDTAAASVIMHRCKHLLDDVDPTTLRGWIRRWKLMRPPYFLLRDVRWEGKKVFLS